MPTGSSVQILAYFFLGVVCMTRRKKKSPRLVAEGLVGLTALDGFKARLRCLRNWSLR